MPVPEEDKMKSRSSRRKPAHDSGLRGLASVAGGTASIQSSGCVSQGFEPMASSSTMLASDLPLFLMSPPHINSGNPVSHAPFHQGNPLDHGAQFLSLFPGRDPLDAGMWAQMHRQDHTSFPPANPTVTTHHPNVSASDLLRSYTFGQDLVAPVG